MATLDVDESMATSYVGKYTLYGTIGEGAFGKVKIAVHNDTKHRVAVKIMDKREIRSQDFTSQVRREIYIMRALKHRHIVRLHEVLTSPTRLYIVMELVTGGELFDRIEHGPIPENLARKYFQQLVDGVDFCHKCGVAHRDLKPENLLVDDNGDIKITDFGFSSMKGRDVNAGLLYTQCGTPDYCAPEIIDSAKVKDGYNGAKVDAWSCGIILYALLCGRLPFQEQETEKLYDLILACKVHYSPHISREARSLLQHLLVRDPSKRYDLRMVKHHPWFLIDYEGDDAKNIKKRPFYHKSQKGLNTSNPSSPMTARVDHIGAALPSSGPTGENHVIPIAGPTIPSFNGEQQDEIPSVGFPATSTEPPREAEVIQHQPYRIQTQDTGIRNTNLAGRPMPPVPRHRDDHFGAHKPNSPASELDEYVRAPTPPTHAVITRVEDRPATPARRRNTSERVAAGFKAASAAAARHAAPLPPPGQLPVPPVSPAYPGQSPTRAGPSPSGSMSPAHYSQFDSKHSTGRIAYEGSGAPFPSPARIERRHHDDSSSEQDSIEDYEEKPPLRLELPTEPLDRLRSSAQVRNQHRHAVPKQRHQSDLGLPSASARLDSPNAVDHGPASMSAVQLQRRGFSRDHTLTAADPSSLRLHLNPERPSSPPVVYSPSGYDRRRSESPGFNARVGLFSESGSPHGSNLAGISGFPSPWQGNGNGYSSSRDEGASSTGGSIQTDIVARHLWNMICKLRGTSKPAGKKLSEELRADFRLMLTEMNQMPRYEDVANIFTTFLSLFETMGLSDGPASSPSSGPQVRSRGTSDMEEEYEDGTTIESRDDYSANGDGKYGVARRAGTDMSSDDVRIAAERRTVTEMSSEEEPPSWSPVLAEPSRHQSDLARRRNISDLLNKMIRRTNRPLSGENSDRPPLVLEEEEPNTTADLAELKRLMRDHHSGREDINITEDLLKLMYTENEEGSGAPFGISLGNTGASQAPPTSASRSADSFGQARYQGAAGSNFASKGNNARPTTPMRSKSGSKVPLPPDYVPGQFQEPNSMPARSGNGGRHNAFASVRAPSAMEASTVVGGPTRVRDNMAGSMGMHDVAYYGHERRNGMATKLRGVLHTMKAKNHKLGERHAQFRSTLPADDIMRLLWRILREMGAELSIKKETKRKMKCRVMLNSDRVLVAGIELTNAEEGVTLVAFRRSKQDKGRTDTESFHSFFERVRNRFIDEANAIGTANRVGGSGISNGRRNGYGGKGARQISDSNGHLSVIS